MWRRLIYLKSRSGICLRCRRHRWSDAAHCFPKGKYRSLRFELDNGAPLCRLCHYEIGASIAARDEFFRAHLGAARFERLRQRSLAPPRPLDVAVALARLIAGPP